MAAKNQLPILSPLQKSTSLHDYKMEMGMREETYNKSLDLVPMACWFSSFDSNDGSPFSRTSAESGFPESAWQPQPELANTG
jgi:hypothetical protein